MSSLEMEKMDEFVEQYMKLLPESGVLEFQKVLEMKSIRRADQNPLIELYRQKIERASVGASAIGGTLDGDRQAAFGGTTTSNPAAPLLSLAMDGNEFRIKKLEKLVKKRL